MANEGYWLTGVGEQPKLGPADVYEPGEGEMLIQVKAVAAQPGEWKMQEGLIPIRIKYPIIIGLSASGIVEKTGPGVTRFKPGDRILTNTTGVIRNDARFGAYQRYCLVPERLTSNISDMSFEEAANIATSYTAMSALVLHLGLNRPQIPSPAATGERILIWGVSSSLGIFATQLATQAGYEVVGVASGRHKELATQFGVAYFVDRTSADVASAASSLGPFKAVLAAADSAEDQVKIGAILAALGGGSFLSTMGVRAGVKLPDNVTGRFAQYIDDYLDEKNSEFTEWFWWNYLEKALAKKRLASIPLTVIGGLDKAGEAWRILKKGENHGTRLIIKPDYTA
ncbi:alcohol dehydrogenase [Trichoderma arundinaceum]|uniref:Alcohol dehydrogenase n=1 Tax=Trichoderma arundinaceum TaxID=490622 RepID=A0A395NTX7_TRIAR|nr:alcohol dehydrogenase [Trichoderma arundinaceum]